VKLILSNEFPRTQITTRLAGAKSIFFGPFPNRASADLFESQFLDLFQLRRCQEDLAPSPAHPGCIYGEMRRCLRPCQQAVTIEEYASEASRVGEFLQSRGARFLDQTAAARDRSSNDLDFEAAAREHARYEKIEQILKLPGDLARDVTRLHGVAVTPSTAGETVNLWFLREGCWLDPIPFSVAPVAGKPVSIDARLREIVASLETPKATLALRQDHLALLTKWFYSSWRDGEWLSFDDLSKLSYRKLVNAVHRAAKA
jgi:excinuclease UvrABC nuclease subunit